MGNSSSVFFGLLFIVGAVLAWMYFEPFDDGVTGFLLTRDKKIQTYDTQLIIMKCPNDMKTWDKLMEIKFYPNKPTSKVIQKNKDRSIHELKNCTILDRKNWKCISGNHTISMTDGDLNSEQQILLQEHKEASQMCRNHDQLVRTGLIIFGAAQAAIIGFIGTRTC